MQNDNSDTLYSVRANHKGSAHTAIVQNRAGRAAMSQAEAYALAASFLETNPQYDVEVEPAHPAAY